MTGNLPTTGSVDEQPRPLSIEANESPQSMLSGTVDSDEAKRSGQEEPELISHDEPRSADEENATTVPTEAKIPNHVPLDFDAIMATLLKDEKELTKEQFDKKYPSHKNLPKPQGASASVAMALVDDIMSGEYDRQLDEMLLRHEARRAVQHEAEPGFKER